MREFDEQMSGQYAAVPANWELGLSDLEYLVWTLELPEKFIKFLPVVLRHCKLAVLTRLDVLDHCQHTAIPAWDLSQLVYASLERAFVVSTGICLVRSLLRPRSQRRVSLEPCV
ncbi:hypothetical protein KC340_g17 [Hortaea werneckii]|nr:hypothetical protein KC340_g17 [Hortaea werneckii]